MPNTVFHTAYLVVRLQYTHVDFACNVQKCGHTAVNVFLYRMLPAKMFLLYWLISGLKVQHSSS